MRLLLDSNIVIWALGGKLKADVLEILKDPGHQLYMSAATLWEIGVKQSNGKLNIQEDYLSILRGQGIEILPINAEHAYAVRSLPKLHRDPFDRMLVTQAIIEDLTIMTSDEMIQNYPVSCFKV